jgi:hypothetical protein
MSDGSKEILDALERNRVEYSARLDALASEVRARDVEQTRQFAKFEGEVRGSISALRTGLTNLEQKIETTDGVARKAMVSVTELETLKSAQQVEILKRLDKQDEDRDKFREAREERERREAEEKRQESIATKRLEETNRTVTERQKVWAPVVQAVIVSMFTGMVAYATVRAQHADTDAKLDAHARQLSSIAQQVSSIASEPSLNAPASIATAYVPSWGSAAGAPAAAAPAPGMSPPQPRPQEGSRGRPAGTSTPPPVSSTVKPR